MILRSPHAAGTLIALVALLAPSAAVAQGGPPPIVREAIDATIEMLEASDRASLDRYVAERLDAPYRAALGDTAADHLTALRDAVRGSTGDIGVERVDDDLLLQLSGAARVTVRMRLDESTGRVGLLELVGREEADSGPGDPRMVRLRAIESLGGTLSPDVFIAEHVSPDLVRALGDRLRPVLDSIARAASASMQLATGPAPDGRAVRFSFRGGANLDVDVTVDEREPHLIVGLELVPVEAGGRGPAESVTPDRLPAVLSELESGGFAGAALVVRNGEVVHRQAYGEADAGSGRANRPTTVFDLGSLPFDFTAGAVYRLAELGRIGLDDPIARYLPDVPADKRSLTVRHVLEHRSGLPNFHHLPGDPDPDLTWIDREEAERRILAMPLLFEPGSERAVSHSSYGLLAAIVDRVAPGGYAGFLRTEFFEPAGMTRTGFYGDDLGLGAEAFAEGRGLQASEPNTPPNWGPTSWLIMGSGGMVSTVDDLHRWATYMRDSGVLTGERREAFLARPVVVGGSERGFAAIMAWNAADDSAVYLLTNTGGPTSPIGDVVRGVMRWAVGG